MTAAEPKSLGSAQGKGVSAERTQKRLLVISPRFLFPMDQGGRIRTANTLRHLKGGAFHITLASPAPANAGDYAAETASVCDRFVSWREPALSTVGKVVALSDREPVTVVTDRSQEGRRVVRDELAKQPDAVLVDFPHAAALIPDQLHVPSIMFTHNVEAEIFARHASLARYPMRPVWQSQARKMHRFEAGTLRRFDRVIAVSVRDARALEAAYGLHDVQPIETGVDTDYYAFHPRPPVPPAGGTVTFTGSMDSRSNIDGIAFLMDQVWPQVLARRPQARALIVGRNPTPAMIATAKSRGLDWTFTGLVDDVRPFVAEAHAYAIPLRVGSGTRIKVFEAMAMGCPVISTRLGSEGLDVTGGEHLLLADTAETFAEAILSTLDDPGPAAARARAARTLVSSRFSWPIVVKQFERICLEALG